MKALGLVFLLAVLSCTQGKADIVSHRDSVVGSSLQRT